jgi:hypothetical protein
MVMMGINRIVVPMAGSLPNNQMRKEDARVSQIDW